MIAVRLGNYHDDLFAIRVGNVRVIRNRKPGNHRGAIRFARVIHIEMGLRRGTRGKSQTEQALLGSGAHAIANIQKRSHQHRVALNDPNAPFLFLDEKP